MVASVRFFTLKLASDDTHRGSSKSFVNLKVREGTNILSV